jgi:hypothetical protein
VGMPLLYVHPARATLAERTQIRGLKGIGSVL